MAVGHRSRDDDRDIVIIDAVWETRPPFPAVDVVKGYADALKQWGISSVMGDDYSGGILPNMFAKHGIAYLSCPLTASQLYLHALPAWTSRMIVMCDASRAVDQLVNLRRKVGQAGQESVVHLGNSHDDIANAISGLIYREETRIRRARPQCTSRREHSASSPLESRYQFRLTARCCQRSGSSPALPSTGCVQ
jgi:hypothetical protein